MDRQRAPTIRVLIRNEVRSHVTKLNLLLYNRVTVEDDFVLYGINDDDCYGDTITFHINDEFMTSPQRWVALMIHRKPYLISREDCMALQHMDDCITIDTRRIINVPFREEGTNNKSLSSSSSSSPLSTSSRVVTTTTTTTRSPFYEHYNEIMIRPMRKKHAIYVEAHYQLFSLANHIKEGEPQYQSDGDMAQYIKLVIDYALMMANFTNGEHRFILENKLIGYALLSSHRAFFDFMLNVVICETIVPPMGIPYLDGTSIRYQCYTQIKCKMLNECVAWEVFRLKRSHERFAMDQYQSLIDEYLVLIDKSDLIPRPAWTYYHIQRDPCNVFWACYEYDRVTIRFEWLSLLVEEGLHLSSTDRLKDGTIWLNTNEFYDYFVPCLYRRILTDSFRFIWMYRLTHRDDKFSQSLVSMEQENFRTLMWPQLPCVDARADVLLEYSNGCLTHITSPITKKLAKRERMIPRRGGNSNSNSNNTPVVPINHSVLAARISSEVDIEELNQYMPPCIKSVMKKGVKLENMDRLTSIHFLIDMGYSKEETIRLLNGTNKQTIAQAYTWQKQRKDVNKLSSLCCDAMIVIDGSMGQTTRCPYEESVNGNVRRKKTEYTYDEKLDYRKQCSESLGIDVKRVASPIDYIRHKINEML